MNAPLSAVCAQSALAAISSLAPSLLLKPIFEAMTSRPCAYPGLAALGQSTELAILGLGKAAPELASGFAEGLLPLGKRFFGLVIGSRRDAQAEQAFAESWPTLRFCWSSHPYTDGHSLAAGDQLADFLRNLPPSIPLLCCLTGGASALVEIPLSPEATVKAGQAARSLILGGAEIGEINRVRSYSSKLKGGGLNLLAGERAVITLAVSDVRRSEPQTIGSGPSWPSTEPPDAALAIARAYQLDLPSIDHGFANEETKRQKAAKPALREYHLLADNGSALDELAYQLKQRGLSPHRLPAFQEGSVEELAQRYLEKAVQLTGAAPLPVVLIAGGEPVIRVSGQAGRGGRNTHLALSLLDKFSQHPLASSWTMHVLALGTDGQDGFAGAAGAAAASTLVQQAACQGQSARHYLDHFDSASFFEQHGCLLHTGPTGTNVCDLHLVALERNTLSAASC